MPDWIRHPPSYSMSEGVGHSNGTQPRSLHDGERLPRHPLHRSHSNLLQRIYQHRTGLLGGFTAEHGCKRLVWFEMHGSMEEAILREKRLKSWRRAWKYELIAATNPTWRDLAEDFGFDPMIK